VRTLPYDRPCHEELAAEYKGKAKVCKVDVDEQPELAERFQVMTIPTVIVFKNGQIAEKTTARNQAGVRAEDRQTSLSWGND
jgi:thioredoxin 1